MAWVVTHTPVPRNIVFPCLCTDSMAWFGKELQGRAPVPPKYCLGDITLSPNIGVGMVKLTFLEINVALQQELLWDFTILKMGSLCMKGLDNFCKEKRKQESSDRKSYLQACSVSELAIVFFYNTLELLSSSRFSQCYEKDIELWHLW